MFIVNGHFAIGDFGEAPKAACDGRNVFRLTNVEAVRVPRVVQTQVDVGREDKRRLLGYACSVHHTHETQIRRAECRSDWESARAVIRVKLCKSVATRSRVLRFLFGFEHTQAPVETRALDPPPLHRHPTPPPPQPPRTPPLPFLCSLDSRALA
jgi:hypothetical protein